MPIYEYQCKKCGHFTEALQKFSDPPLTTCDVCGGTVKKLISHNSFHLKGSGWYVTDYASKSGGYDGKTSSTDASTQKKDTKETKEVKTAAKTSESKDS